MMTTTGMLDGCQRRSRDQGPAVTLRVEAADRPWLAAMLAEEAGNLEHIAENYERSGDPRHAAHLRHRMDVINTMVNTIAELADWKRTVADTEFNRLGEALGWFLTDARFQVAVRGNPSAVEAMLAEARSRL